MKTQRDIQSNTFHLTWVPVTLRTVAIFSVILFMIVPALSASATPIPQSRNTLSDAVPEAGAYAFHTFYGAADQVDTAIAVDTDSSGNIYLAGRSSATWGSPLHAFTGTGGDTGYNAVIMKLDSKGNHVWHTFYGTKTVNYVAMAQAIAVDSSGNVYVAGYSHDPEDVWKTGLSPKHAHSGGNNADVFVLKLDKDGALQWYTFYGGSGLDWGMGITLDGSGNVYVAGYTTDGSWSGLSAKHGYSGDYDILVLKLDNSGVYQWHTFYGSSSYDSSYAIAVDGSDNVYVTGASGATWQHESSGNPLRDHSVGTNKDIVVLKLNPQGQCQWHTFYGGSGDDYGMAITYEAKNGFLLINGYSNATWQGDLPEPDPITAYAGGYDMVMLGLGTDGVYHGHLFAGSSVGNDYGRDIATTPDGKVYLIGWSTVGWLGPDDEDPLNEHTSGDNEDIMTMELDSYGGYLWHAFVGAGSGTKDYGNGVAIDRLGNVIVVGSSEQTWTAAYGHQPMHDHSTDSSAAYADILITKAFGPRQYLPQIVR